MVSEFLLLRVRAKIPARESKNSVAWKIRSPLTPLSIDHLQNSLYISRKRKMKLKPHQKRNSIGYSLDSPQKTESQRPFCTGTLAPSLAYSKRHSSNRQKPIKRPTQPILPSHNQTITVLAYQQLQRSTLLARQRKPEHKPSARQLFQSGNTRLAAHAGKMQIGTAPAGDYRRRSSALHL